MSPEDRARLAHSSRFCFDTIMNTPEHLVRAAAVEGSAASFARYAAAEAIAWASHTAAGGSPAPMAAPTKVASAQLTSAEIAAREARLLTVLEGIELPSATLLAALRATAADPDDHPAHRLFVREVLAAVEGANRG